MEKFFRKYINRGTDDDPVWQLLPDECGDTGPETLCSGAQIAHTLKQAFVKEFTEKNGKPLWRVMFDAIGEDAFGDVFNNASGEPDPAIIVSKLHLKYHLRMAPVNYFYSRDITDWYLKWPYPPKPFYRARGWYSYGHTGYDIWGHSQFFFGIRDGHPSSSSALQANLEYWRHHGGGNMTKYKFGASQFGTHPWAQDWGEAYLKEEWPPNWLIDWGSSTSSGVLNPAGAVGRGPRFQVSGSDQIFDFRFLTNMQQFLDMLLWELTFFVFGSSGDKILYPNGESIYGQYPNGSHQFVTQSLYKDISTYQESSNWSPGGHTSSSSSTFLTQEGSLLIPFMDLDWCPEPEPES